MFWKIEANKCSITTRLTVLYASSAFVVLAVAIIFLYQVLIGDLQRDASQFLNNEVNIISNILKKNPKITPALQQEVQWEPTTVGLSKYHYYARVTQPNNQVLIETPGLSRLIDHQSLLQAGYHGDNKIIAGNHGQMFMLVSASVQISNNVHPFIIQVALDISHNQKIIDNYRKRVIWVLLLGIVISTLLGIFVARRGMRPLGLIVAKLKDVGVKKLHARLLVEDFPRELADTALALNNMLARLEEAFQRLSDFSSNLAHELRTPINTLMVQTEVVLSQQRTPEEYQEALISILEEHQHLSNLIDRLLFLARAENPKMHIKQDEVALHELVDACQEFYEAVAEEKNIKVIRRGEARLKGDGMLLQRAINNLLSNALYYTEPGGMVTLTVESFEHGVRLIVADTGVGIDEAHINKLFDRFYRVDDARTRHSGRTGLGLAIVKTIMDLHHGHVAVQSKSGHGTSVTLTFPLI